MSRIHFELFGADAEVIDILQDSENELVLEFSAAESELADKLTEDSFVRLSNLAERLSDKMCVFDLRLIENGEYTPELFLKDRRIPLPTIRKAGFLVQIDDCTADYIRSASQRERRLEAAVRLIEEKIALLDDRVFGTTIL